MTRGYLIGEGFRDRIERTIERVSGTPYGGGATNVTPRLEMIGGSQKVFRICTFTGSWAIDADKAVTFKGVTTTPNTVSARNLFCGLSPGTVTCDVSIAKDGTAWYLVQPNLTQQPGYSASGTQVLTITSGNLRWVGTTACS